MSCAEAERTDRPVRKAGPNWKSDVAATSQADAAASGFGLAVGQLAGAVRVADEPDTDSTGPGAAPELEDPEAVGETGVSACTGRTWKKSLSRGVVLVVGDGSDCDAVPQALHTRTVAVRAVIAALRMSLRPRLFPRPSRDVPLSPLRTACCSTAFIPSGWFNFR